MENPEEILHSLEEFAKMKPKDIPRELEEYLKFVAKTGDPIYQWSAIKSLFREKFLNVITEFYESCASMEIPPCPNVEMFNYDLMKNFILEKFDTFVSAPFTLQRICELLTSPRKEYTRIDKYMRALEKNILVVSTMEPGGRRTENGEGIMNGVESDHDIVPEPSNEINVEEMDDSPYIQTTNHLSDRISFDNTKNGTHIDVDNTAETFNSEKVSSEASTSSQEIVCVQYVSIEPVVSETVPNSNEESKDNDVSVTITAINVNEDKPETEPETTENVDQQEPTLTENEAESILDENTETVADQSNINKTVAEPESDVCMDTDIATESSKETETAEVSSDTAPSSTTMTETLPEEQNPPQAIPESSESEALPQTIENETISPENTITSSDIGLNIETEASVELPTSNIAEPLEDKSVKEPLKVTEDIVPENKDTEGSDNVDSTTKASGDDKLEFEASDSKEEPTSETTEALAESQKEETKDISNLPSEDIPDTSNEICALASTEEQNLTADETKNISEELKLEKEQTELKPEEVASVTEATAEEKETPMEVDTVPENTTEKEPESSEPPEKP